MNDKRKELHELIDNMLDEFEQVVTNSMELASKETARCIMEMLQEAIESQNEMICKNNCINVVWLAGKISSKYGAESCSPLYKEKRK